MAEEQGRIRHRIEIFFFLSSSKRGWWDSWHVSRYYSFSPWC